MSEITSLLPFQPSLAQATNTRVDTACRHMQQCRVSTDDMLRFVKNDRDELERNVFRYCVHKDEIVVGIGRPWFSGASVKRVGNSAYPRIISNLGALADDGDGMVAINMIRFMNHYARTIRERKLIIDFFLRDVHTPAQFRMAPEEPMVEAGPNCEAFRRAGSTSMMGTNAHVGMMYDFFGVGVASTLGYAHANSGDTMSSVMIGGLRTVQNGDFELFTGDLVQFYWMFEKDDFTQDGRRKPYLDIWEGETPQNVDPRTTENFRSAKRDAEGRETWERRPDAQIRQTYHDLSYGQRAGKEKIVAKIKPYIADEENPRLFDWYRVFAVAISGARPNEACDIKISRQSM